MRGLMPASHPQSTFQCANKQPPDSAKLSGGYPYAFLASPSGKMILLTKKKMTIEIPPLRTVVPML